MYCLMNSSTVPFITSCAQYPGPALDKVSIQQTMVKYLIKTILKWIHFRTIVMMTMTNICDATSGSMEQISRCFLTLQRIQKKQLSVYEEEKAAEFLKNGLLKKENDSLIVQLPVLKTETANQIMKLIKAELTELAEEYVELVSKGIEELLLPYVRKDLMNCFINWDMHSFFEPKGALFYYGWDKSLAQPEDYSTSAAGLYVLTE